MEDEIWKSVSNTGYLVSSLGRVKGIHGRIIQLSKNGRGYLQFRLYVNATAKTKTVHRLVASAFLENPDSKPQVNHKDGNKSNNAVLNLEWATGEENMAHAKATGLIHSGEAHERAVLTTADVTRICSVEFSSKSNEEIAKAFGVHSSTIYSLRIGRAWASSELPRLQSMPRSERTPEVILRRKSAAARGETHGLAQLDEEKVLAILGLFAEGLSNQEIATSFDVSRSAIYDIRSGRSWQHVTMGELRIKSAKETGLKKILAEDIPAIRAMHMGGLTNSEIGRKFNVHNGTIHSILSGKTWKNY